jgi:hypothetical protein
MKKVPYQGNPGNACALACYTMVAQYLLPDKNITYEQLAMTGQWKPGYVVWGFAIWQWLMDQGMYMTDYDTIDYEAWAQQGAKGLQASVPAKEFTFYKDNTHDLDEESRTVNLMHSHPHFTYIKRAPIWGDVVEHVKKPGICDVTLNAKVLNRQKGFAVHRVVLVAITDKEVVFHDPTKNADGAYRREPVDHFKMAFVDSPELAHYSLAGS